MSHILDAIRDGNIMAYRSTRFLTAAFFALLLLWLGISVTRTTSAPQIPVPVAETPPSSQDEEPQQNAFSVDHIMGHRVANILSPNIQVAKVSISVSEADIPSLPLMQRLNIKLPKPSEMTLSEENDDTTTPVTLKASSTTQTSLQIPLIPREPINASEFIFGVATTYERLETSLDVMAHWAAHSNTQIIGHMQPSLDASAADRVLAKAKALAIPLGTVESGLEFLDRYFTMLGVLHASRTPSTKWYVFIDDDTFFFSLATLVAAFAKYDPTQPWYVGALSEDFNQMAQWGYMAYGGGGIFLSAALVDLLMPHYTQCFERRNTGDRMIAQCIYKHTNTKLTWEHNLHQLDLHRDQSGFYEALRPQPLSIHHWRSEGFHSSVDVRGMATVATVCGDSCVLQKFKFADGWVLTNGFSIVKYSAQDLNGRDLETDISMEGTWDFFGGTGPQHFEHSLGPLRAADVGKISYRLESALVEREGRTVRQLYVKRKPYDPENQLFGEVDAVIEVEWHRG